MQVIKTLLIGFGLLSVLWIGSCSLMGYGAAVAVKSAVNSDLAHKAVKQHKEHMRRQHNDELDREAYYEDTRRRERQDYYDNRYR